MTDSEPTSAHAEDRAHTTRIRGGLGNINLDSIAESDAGTSSQDELPDSQEDSQAAQCVIGVSISKTQTRLAHPETPAIEKAAAIEDGGGYFNKLWNQPEIAEAEASDEVESPNQPPPDTVPQRSEESKICFDTRNNDNVPALELPSPWTTAPQQAQKLSTGKTLLRDGLRKQVQRQRSSSGPESLRMRLPFRLPSLSKGSFIPNAKASAPRSEESMPQKDGRWSERKGRRESLSGNDPTNSSTSSSSTLTLTQNRRPAATQVSTPTHVKRAASDDSLFLQRSLSTASSLGDDSRFEKIDQMVNSRLKALKDSLQDTNFKLNMAHSLPRVASLRFNFSQSSLDVFSGESGRGVSRSRPRGSWASSINLLSSPKNGSRGDSHREEIAKPRGPTASMTAANAALHPNFVRALGQLQGDIVILGGYRGSILRSSEPPNRRLWIPLKAGLNLRKVNLEVGLDDEDEETMRENIVPDGMLTHIGPVDISRRLLKRLQASENAMNGKLRVHNYGYDWRLTPHRLSREFIQFLEQLPSNRRGVPKSGRGATVIAHSLGGLIVRHAVNECPGLFAGVIYAGVPQYAVNILGPLRNGDEVLLSSRILTAQVNFTVRTTYALLPLDGKCFFNQRTKEEYPVDFFDINNWIEHRWSPCIDPPLPPFIAPTSSLGNIMASVFPSKSLSDLPFVNRRGSQSRCDRLSSANSPAPEAQDKLSSAVQSAQATSHTEGPANSLTMQMGGRQCTDPLEHSNQRQTGAHSRKPSASPATTCTLERNRAIAYLTRTLHNTFAFKSQLAHNPSHAEANAYPPFAVVYGKSEPTVYGAKVASREAIKHSDAYDDLAFASGDGVVLARAAMLPEGYRAVKGGVIATTRGHVGLLGDLEGVGRALLAVIRGRERGVGLGRTDEAENPDAE